MSTDSNSNILFSIQDGMYYDYKLYYYPLNINGINYSQIQQTKQHGAQIFLQKINDSNISINEIPLPKNEIEQYLYPHVVDHLRPILPIKLRQAEDMFGDGYILIPVGEHGNVRIGINKFDDAYLMVYYSIRKIF